MSGEAEVSSELQALRATTLELSAGGASVGVDLACVRLVAGSEVDTTTVRPCRKCVQPEVSGLNLQRDVIATYAMPSQQIFRRDEDASVVSGAAAGAATQAIERLLARDPRVVRGRRRDCRQKHAFSRLSLRREDYRDKPGATLVELSGRCGYRHEVSKNT